MGEPRITRFSSMKFPKHEHREYPKKMTNADGQRITVYNEQEEEAARGTKKEAPVAKEEVDEDEEEDAQKQQELLDALLKEAEELNIKVKDNWTLEQLQTKVNSERARLDALAKKSGKAA